MDKLYRVVIIDDSDWTRRGLREMIPWEESGFTVIGEAGDGKRGLALIEGGKPDVVIVDIKMPELDGLHMIEQSREREGSTSIEFIIISAYDDFTFARQAIVLGARDYLLKPIDREEVLRSLGRIKHFLDFAQEGRRGIDLLPNEVFSPDFWHMQRLVDVEYNERTTIAGYAIGRMKDRFQTNLSAYDVAQELNISESTLVRQFKKHTGHTFGDVLTFVRIRGAVDLLLLPTSRVKEVAAQVGYADARYFSEVFQKIAGCTPSDLKKWSE